MLEINLVCPYCGGYTWEVSSENEDKYVCADCSGESSKEEMHIQVFEQ